MKKNVLIGCGVLVLFFLIWIGARNLNATVEADVLSDNAATAGTEDDDAAEETTDDPEVSTDNAETEETDDVSDDAEVSDDVSDDAEDAAEEEGNTEEAENAAETAVVSSDENVLYTISTSSGSNLGMVPIVGGNAVVLMDGRYATIYQGDYTPEEQNAFNYKLEGETALAASAGKIEAWAFYREALLYDFAFPEGITSIEKFAFARSSLNSVSIPEGVTSIGYGAFYHCDALTDVLIPDSVTVIEENAFTHTPWLENWMAGGAETAEEDGMTEVSDEGDFLIVGDGILLAYRGSEANPELPAEVKSVVPGVFEE